MTKQSKTFLLQEERLGSAKDLLEFPVRRRRSPSDSGATLEEGSRPVLDTPRLLPPDPGLGSPDGARPEREVRTLETDWFRRDQGREVQTLFVRYKLSKGKRDFILLRLYAVIHTPTKDETWSGFPKISIRVRTFDRDGFFFVRLSKFW